ncbi:alpha/beta hydrolase [Nonomuraea sp. NPDC050153]|uniref:alpha/beta hydrolase n=1 Tax=Nonomuraea sp. NPDC050153 TaxID=3364359 RepID=UPI0037BD9E8B
MTPSTAAAEETALLGLPPEPPDRTVRYGPHPAQVVDFYLPAGAAAERVTVLHGGFWRAAFDRTHLSPLAAALARRGTAVALAEFRQVGDDGGWPGTFDDVAAVADTTWEGADHVLLGHSAGGHLALWAAHRARLPSRSRWTRDGAGSVRAVVAVAPVADLDRAHRLGLSHGAVAELLGGEELVRARLPEADPARLLPATVPVTILHGTIDPDVPIELSRAYSAASGAELHELPGIGHFAPVTPGSAAFAELLTALRTHRPPRTAADA